MKHPPIAFMSYVRDDDAHNQGRLSRFRTRLAAEVRTQTGETFQIFQDRDDITWGQQWRARIEEGLNAVTFLIPVITPSFFRSTGCRDEVKQFVEREKQLGRNDLILPLYYVDAETFNDARLREADPLAKLLWERNYADWRQLRLKTWASPPVKHALARLAEQVRDAMRMHGNRSAEERTAESVPSPRSIDTPPVTVDTAKAPGAGTVKEPPILVVDAMHRGDYATLSEAIRAAEAGARILVRPGYYVESVLIDKPLEIIGDGPREDIIVEGRGRAVVRFKTTMGRVANLTLRLADAAQAYAVDIGQGRLDLEDCDIQSRGLSCVGIHDAADPRLRRNRIHDGKQGGVFIYDGARGTLEDNDIFGNALAGVEITSGADPVLRRNRIHDGKTSGVLTNEGGRGTLEENHIFGNALSGVEIRSEADPVLRRNRIHDGKTSGVYFINDARGTLEDNDIFGNAYAGVQIKSGADPVLRRNRIYDGKTSGVYFNDDARGTLEDNDIFGNAYAGVQIKSGADPVLRRNRIHDGKQVGVFINEGGRGTLEDNEIFGNAYAGVEITQNGSNPVLRRNRINRNGYEAIWVYAGAAAECEENDLRENTLGPWDIAGDSRDKVVKSKNIEK